jgi:hypothetical protein
MIIKKKSKKRDAHLEMVREIMATAGRSNSDLKYIPSRSIYLGKLETAHYFLIFYDAGRRPFPYQWWRFDDGGSHQVRPEDLPGYIRNQQIAAAYK